MYVNFANDVMKRRCLILPTQFQDIVQLFSLVIYLESSGEHLLRDKWCWVKICQWTN